MSESRTATARRLFRTAEGRFINPFGSGVHSPGLEQSYRWLAKSRKLAAKKARKMAKTTGGKRNRQILAVHEAGHALVAHVLGLSIKSVAIDLPPHDGIEHGGTDPIYPYGTGCAEFALVALAGPLAEQRYTGNPMPVTKDWQQYTARKHLLTTTHEETQRWVDGVLEKNWDSVKAIAKALRTKGRLTGVEVAALVQGTR